MKRFLTILPILISLTSFSQDSYIASWSKVNNASYDVLQSTDGVNYSKLATITDTFYTVPGPTYYYKIKVNTTVPFYSNSVLVYAVLPVSIINVSILPSTKYVTINWTSQNETNLKGYEIKRSFDGATFDSVAMVAAKGNSNYSIVIYRPTSTTTSGHWWWKKTTTTIDSRKEIFQIISVDVDGLKNVLKTISE